jgi:hypothetical protein
LRSQTEVGLICAWRSLRQYPEELAKLMKAMPRSSRTAALRTLGEVEIFQSTTLASETASLQRHCFSKISHMLAPRHSCSHHSFVLSACRRRPAPEDFRVGDCPAGSSKLTESECDRCSIHVYESEVTCTGVALLSAKNCGGGRLWWFCSCQRVVDAARPLEELVKL